MIEQVDLHKLQGGRDSFMVCVITVRCNIKESSISRLEDEASFYEPQHTFPSFSAVLLYLYFLFILAECKARGLLSFTLQESLNL